MTLQESLQTGFLSTMLAEAFASTIVANLHKDNPDTMNQFFRSLAKYKYSMQGCKDEFITETTVSDALKKNKSDKVLKIWMKGNKIGFFSVANTVIDSDFNWNGKTSPGKRDNSKVFGDPETIKEAFTGIPWSKLGFTKVYMIAFSSLKALGQGKQPTEVVDPKTENIIEQIPKFEFSPKFNTNYKFNNLPAYVWLWVYERSGKVKRHVLTFVDDSVSGIINKVTQEYAKWYPIDGNYIDMYWADFLNDQLSDCIKFDQTAKKCGLVFRYEPKLPKDEYLHFSFRATPTFKTRGKYIKAFIAEKGDLKVIYCPDEAFILKIENDGVVDSDYTDFDDFSIKLPELMRSKF